MNDPIKHERLITALTGFGYNVEMGWPTYPTRIWRGLLWGITTDPEFIPDGELETAAIALAGEYLMDEEAFRAHEWKHQNMRRMVRDMYLDAGFEEAKLRRFFPDLYPEGLEEAQAELAEGKAFLAETW